MGPQNNKVLVALPYTRAGEQVGLLKFQAQATSQGIYCNFCGSSSEIYGSNSASRTMWPKKQKKQCIICI